VAVGIGVGGAAPAQRSEGEAVSRAASVVVAGACLAALFALAAPVASAQVLPDLIFKDGFETSCSAFEDSCFDALDNDCDGLVDCADSDCGPVAECVIDPAPFGFGTVQDDLAAACPTGYDGTGTPLFQGLVVPTNCTGCSCAASLNCGATLSEMSSCPVGTLLRNVLLSEACAALSPPFSTGGVHVSALTVNQLCTPSGTPTPAPTSWSSDARFCPTLLGGGGCASGSSCRPRALLYCAWTAGDETCPSGYVPEGTGGPWYTGLEDYRICGTACGCSPPGGGSCGTSFVRGFSGAGCAGTSYSLQPGGATCSLPPLNSANIQLQGQVVPTCMVMNVVPTGSVLPTGPTTLCCR
jgi:hypothetical protein